MSGARGEFFKIRGPVAVKDFQRKGRGTDQREFKRNVGGLGGCFARNESTFQSRNKLGNLARISGGGQVCRRGVQRGARDVAREREDEARRRGARRKKERKSEGDRERRIKKQGKKERKKIEKRKTNRGKEGGRKGGRSNVDDNDVPILLVF